MSTSAPVDIRRIGPLSLSPLLADIVFGFECLWLCVSSPPLEVSRPSQEAIAPGASLPGLGLVLLACATGVCF